MLRILVSLVLCMVFLAVPGGNVQAMPFTLPAPTYAVGTTPASVAVGDFNGDGHLDLAVTNEGSNDVSILLGVGNGTFTLPAPTYAVGTDPYSVAVGYFNGDVHLDLAVANNVSNDVSILLGVGGGTFAAAVNYAVGTNPASVAVGYFNGDGAPDLAVANINSNDVSILLNTPEPPTVTGVNPTSGVQGQTLAVTVTGTNFTGATAVSFGAGITVNSFTVNSATQITANITIDAGAAPGARDVSVTTPGGTGTLTGGFTVTAAPPPSPPPSPPPKPRASPSPPRPLSPPSLTLQYLSINPQQTSANQPVTITTNVVNTGDEGGNYSVALKINGQTEQSKMVSVGPQGTQPVKFTVTKAQPGTYTVDIAGQKGSFIILGAGGKASSPVSGGLIAILILGVLVLATVAVLMLGRRPA
ncbi:MAG: VCBS repeat-containing protein [Chloroflexi bacterium]|nr:VCBS repeat-containing protein [Chloroflexota bacterium]